MRKQLQMILISVILCLLLIGFQALASPDSGGVYNWPGFNGAGYEGMPSGKNYSAWFDDDDDSDDDDDDEYEEGWRQNPDGWWYRYSDGSWPANCWLFIDGRWYRFGDSGLAVTGWYTEADGSRYYLNPVDDGTYGAMRTGWQLIGGEMYYFNPNAKTGEGRLLTNTVTPDGYQVGSDGRLVR